MECPRLPAGIRPERGCGQGADARLAGQPASDRQRPESQRRGIPLRPMVSLSSPQPAPASRLVSLDALRGFDMIWILGADALVRGVAKLWDIAPLRIVGATGAPTRPLALVPNA